MDSGARLRPPIPQDYANSLLIQERAELTLEVQRLRKQNQELRQFIRHMSAYLAPEQVQECLVALGSAAVYGI